MQKCSSAAKQLGERDGNGGECGNPDCCRKFFCTSGGALHDVVDHPPSNERSDTDYDRPTMRDSSNCRIFECRAAARVVDDDEQEDTADPRTDCLPHEPVQRNGKLLAFEKSFLDVVKSPAVKQPDRTDRFFCLPR